MADMQHPVIPIHDANPCGGRRPLRERPPQLHGDGAQLQALIRAVSDAVCGRQGPIDAAQPVGAWLRVLRLDADEVELQLAAELGCRGQLAAQLAFDVLRGRLRDRDIYVRIEPEAALPVLPAAA